MDVSFESLFFGARLKSSLARLIEKEIFWHILCFMNLSVLTHLQDSLRPFSMMMSAIAIPAYLETVLFPVGM